MNIKGITIPSNYKSKESLIGTEIKIKEIKDFFEKNLAKKLDLVRVSAPLFVESDLGLNDNLSGHERPIRFDLLNSKQNVEIVHSLAKWKRYSLHRYNFEKNKGLYTDMNAIRRDEELDNLHSIYVDQWDWEKIISKEDRTMDTLKDIVKEIYEVFKETEKFVLGKDYEIYRKLPEEIYFITSQELEDRYKELDSKSRENKICKEHKAVFISQIGDKLKSGLKHDERSPDYDDWKLNGDIIFWYPLLNQAVELSSMGIRVDKEALNYQLKESNSEDRKSLRFHSMLLNEELPYTIGGGIGQSRMCMYFLNKAHIGEVQASIWDSKNREICNEYGIELL